MNISAERHVIDADGHVFELNPGMVDWFKYLPEDRRAWSPKTFPFNTGGNSVLVQGEIWGGHFRTTKTEPPKDQARMFQGKKGMYEPETRLQHLDLEGVGVAVLFGSYMGRGAGAIRDPTLSRGVCMAYNDWIAGFCQADARRLKAVAEVPLKDPDMAAEELRRAVRELGLVGVVAPPNVEGRSLDDDSLFGSIFATAEALGIPVCVHPITGVPSVATVNHQRTDQRFFGAATLPLDLMIAMSCLFSGGLLERHPRVRVGFLEVWAGWLPFWLDRLSSAYERFGRQVQARATPRELWATGQCYVSPDPDETTLGALIDLIGEDQLLFATDYWHPDSKFPESVKRLLAMEGLSTEVKEKVLWNNAARFYNLAL